MNSEFQLFQAWLVVTLMVALWLGVDWWMTPKPKPVHCGTCWADGEEWANSGTRVYTGGEIIQNTWGSLEKAKRK